MRLVKNVRVGGVWYGPAYGNEADVPDDVAEKIENPRAWEQPEQSDDEGERDRLVARAEELGVKVHANSKTDTIRRKVEEAEAQENG